MVPVMPTVSVMSVMSMVSIVAMVPIVAMVVLVMITTMMMPRPRLRDTDKSQGKDKRRDQQQFFHYDDLIKCGVLLTVTRARDGQSDAAARGQHRIHSTPQHHTQGDKSGNAGRV